MPWIRSSEIVPPLSSSEREEVADGRAVTRQTPEGVIVVNPRSVVTSYGIVTGVGVTFGPNGEDAFFHRIAVGREETRRD
jgi:hypothetical protein